MYIIIHSSPIFFDSVFIVIIDNHTRESYDDDNNNQKFENLGYISIFISPFGSLA